MKNTIGIILVIGMLFSSLMAEEVNTGQDFTKPLTRLDFRLKYQAYEGDFSAWYPTLRADKPFVLGGGWVLSSRADLPFAYTDIPTAEDSDSRFGISDFLVQGLMIAPQGERNWTWAFGVQAVAPSATDNAMGTGRFHAAPLVGFKLNAPSFGPGGFAAVLISNHFDMGGDEERGEVNYMAVQPVFNFNLPQSWFISISPEMRVNWEQDDAVFFPFDLMLGKMITSSVVVSAEYKTPIVEDYSMYENEFELRAGFFF